MGIWVTCLVVLIFFANSSAEDEIDSFDEVPKPSVTIKRPLNNSCVGSNIILRVETDLFFDPSQRKSRSVFGTADLFPQLDL